MQNNGNEKSKTLCYHDEDSTRTFFIYGESVPCHPGWSLEASLKDTTIQEVAALTISQEDDGEMCLVNEADDGRLSQLDDLQANHKISNAQMQKMTAKNQILETHVATMQEVLDQVTGQKPEYLEFPSKFFSVFKRDKLRENLSGTNVQVIQRGNVSAH